MAYSADTFVADEQPTTAKWNKLWSNDGAFNDGSGFANGALGSVHASLADGVAVQVQGNGTSAVGTSTTRMVWDDTIPQSGEGFEVLTQAITPKSTTNKLVIRAVLYVSDSVVNNIVGAIFQDSTADALYANNLTGSTATGMEVLTLEHIMTAGTTSATTFKVRVGGTIAGTTTINGSGGGRKLGAIPKSTITITEYKAS